ncbi:hypothetical protein GmHk_06G015171 [Glycine max]|nr:hypothetical protein GmHk_06G015171 [Glycine max]
MEENASSTEALTRKLDEILTETENDAGQFCFKEETVEKFMQELYKEIIASPPTPSNAVQVQNDSVGLQVVIGEDKTDEGHFDEDDWLARVLRWGQSSKQYVASFLRCFWATKFRRLIKTQPFSSQMKRNSACARDLKVNYNL